MTAELARGSESAEATVHRQSWTAASVIFWMIYLYPPTIVRGAGVAIERRHLSSLALPHRATARSSEAKRKVRHNDATEPECSR